jgi:quinohemoprotein ethanol dehydrogenase
MIGSELRRGCESTGRYQVSALLLAFCSCAAIAQISPADQPVDATRIENADGEPGQWLSHGRTYSEQRYSPLTQIDRDSVEELGLAWHTATGNKRGMEATPLVADGVMYVSTAWSRVMALDAVTGGILWRFDPQVPGSAGRNACCDVVNRGVAIWKDRVYVGTIDGRLIAINARTGKQTWSVQTTDPAKPYTITGAPRVMRDKVVIGNGGAEFGVRGYFSAYDAATGEQLWRFYTVPGSADGPLEHEELAAARRTWSPDSLWETGLGGTVWDAFAYDPELNLLYVGVGNSSPYNRAIRSPGGGDNLYLTSILAINPDTGRMVWHYQTTPAESWDYTATQHMILAEIELLGERRRVLMQAPKNGFFYVLDRVTGELLSAKNYVPVNWASHVNLETGRPVETGLGEWGEQDRMVSPSVFGGHNWHPMAFSPDTGLVYIPTLHMVYPFRADPGFRYDPGVVNTGEDWKGMARSAPSVMPGFCSPTRLTAWDPVTQSQAWQVPFDSGVSAGVLATAGGLVFQGNIHGELVAFRDDSGERIWSGATNIGLMAPPISYAVDGEQYIAIVAGIGGALGTHTDALRLSNAGHVFAFKLNANATPPDVPVVARKVQVPEQAIDQRAVAHGGELYSLHCLRCHGVNAKSSGVFPDLRTATASVHEGWSDIVLGGALKGAGMASFSDVLSVSDALDIHAFVIKQALDSTALSRRLLEGAAAAICIPAEWLAD